MGEDAFLLIKGFQLGMLLQLAVGPICFFVFQAAAAGGFVAGTRAVLGVATVDLLYIGLSIAGLSALLKRAPGALRLLKGAGALVLALFGLSIGLSPFGFRLLPSLSLPAGGGDYGRALLLTLSNPMAILFWGGVFSLKAAEEKMSRRQMTAFGAGAVLATLSFLTAVAALGAWAGGLLPQSVMDGLNVAVGVALVAYAAKMLLGGNKEDG